MTTLHHDSRSRLIQLGIAILHGVASMACAASSEPPVGKEGAIRPAPDARSPALAAGPSPTRGAVTAARRTATGHATAPGLRLLRDDARPRLARQVGVDTLDQLPIYEIDQAIDDVSGRFSARLVLHYTNLTGTSLAEIPLLLHPNASLELGAPAGSVGSLEITSVAIAGASAPRWKAVRPTLVVVDLPGRLAARERVTLVVQYAGRLRDLGPRANDIFAQAMSSVSSLASSGSSDYGLMAMGDGIVTLASAFPMVAPWREGSFDTGPPSRIGDLSYNIPASFRVRTAIPAGMTLVSNLIDAAATPAEAGTQVVVSEGAMVRDLVLVAGRDLERVERQVGATRVASIHRGKDARGGRLALDAAVAALQTFEKRFGPYPYTELDVAEASIVGGAGGVEFCAMVLIAGSLYRDPADSTSPLAMTMKMWTALAGQLDGALGGGGDPQAAAQQLMQSMDSVLEFTVAHEVAHQWFAELVGNDSGRFPMLDEPLAQYAAGLAVEDRRGKAAARAAMDSSVKMNYALYRLMGGADRPVLGDTASYRTPIEYAGLVYGKAPYLYVALRRSLGDAVLDRAIRTAVRERRFKLSTIDEWIDALEKGAGGRPAGVRKVFARWLGERHGDRDLGVDDSGDFVIDVMLPPDVARSVREAMPLLGMKPRELMTMLFGGGLDGAPTGPGIDLDQALRALDGEP